MPVANRAKRLYSLAQKLDAHFGLSGDGRVEAEYDEYTRPAKWLLKWEDGPSLAQLVKAAKQIDAEALSEATPFRRYSGQVWALAAIRLTIDAGEPPDTGYYPNSWHVREWLEKRRAPQARNARERGMAERLAAMADESGSWKGPETVTTDACAERGIAWLLEDFPEAPLSPAELLTARYATGEDRKAWAYRLTPMPPLQAFSAVQADPEAAHDAITAALTLLPDLHAALDTAAADLQRRAPQPASVPLDPAGVLPADWVRFVSPPWGARLDQVKPTCVRTKTGGTACTRQAAEWPASFAEMADPQACWSHLDEPEREACERARASYRAAFWELKNAHYETAGHTRDERCEGCTWPSGQQPAVNF